MRQLKITGSLSQNEIDIPRFEQQFSVQLPEYFKEFINIYSGSVVYENWVNEKYSIDYILPLYSNDNISIEMITEKIRFFDKDDELTIGRNDLIPFACEIGQRFFCVSIGKDDYSQVYLTDWVEETRTSLRKIANNFEEFLDNIKRNEKEDKEMTYQSGKGEIEFIIRKFFINNPYGEGIIKVRNRIFQHSVYSETWSDLKICIKDRIFLENELLSIFHTHSITLKKDTQEEAYKWIELLIKNVELEDESQIVQYPLFKDGE